MLEGKILVPPLKIQGIKTKIVPTIRQYAALDKDAVWVEPFMGSGVVGFNMAPEKAVFADINPHIIAFYQQIQDGSITPHRVRGFLEQEGAKLEQGDADYYMEVRARFNRDHEPLDFLFLNRSCFNGMMRFNRKNEFNVPYGHKPERFAKAYVTKIVNQVANVERLIREHDWTFVCQSFEQTIANADSSSFIYCDPPYIGRHVDYFDNWDAEREQKLHDVLTRSGARFMVSTWESTAYRRNTYIDDVWAGCEKITRAHFYHVGAREENRSAVIEALLLNYPPREQPRVDDNQLSFFTP